MYRLEVSNLQRFVLSQNHLVETDAEDLPEALQGQRDVLFANIQEIYTFHTRQFLHELEACVKNPDAVPKVFKRFVSTFQCSVANYFPL